MTKTRLLRAALADERNLNDLLASWADDVQQIAFDAARRAGVSRAHEFDEVLALAWTEVAKMINDERTGAARTVYRFDAHLVMRLRNAVRSWADSEAGRAPAARMSGVLRRRRAIRALTDQGMEPADAVELLAASRRRDGVYDVADLTIELATINIDDEELQVPARLDDSEMAELMMEPQAGYVLAPFEGRAFVEQVVADVAGVDAGAARVVRAWLETVWAGDETATASALARRLRLSPVDVQGAVELGRRLAAARLERMGVHVALMAGTRPGEAP